jgi:AraC-like DNA-binding protein
MTEFVLPSYGTLQFKPANAEKFKGLRIPGAQLFALESQEVSIFKHVYEQPLFTLTLISIYCQQPLEFTVRNREANFRLDVVLTGSMQIREKDRAVQNMGEGQYRLTDKGIFGVTFNRGQGCQYLSVLPAREMIEQMELGIWLQSCSPRSTTTLMRDIVNKILANHFNAEFRKLFYDNCVRELLFYHAAAPKQVQEGELTEAEIAAVHAADQIIVSNLNKHYTTHQLARMVRTNVFTLKRGFARIMGMGTFERLQRLKMERAIFLLETTDKLIQDIAELAGYESVAGFINSFRKQFGMTPKDWRKKKRGD